jgi:PAS domain S-box-containing protein
LRVPLRLLIVEDLPEQAEIVAHELTKTGFDLAWSIASNLAGCRFAIEDGVDVVVADCNTAEVDLSALMVLLDELSDPPPVVSLSTDDSEEVAGECLRAGASAFLHKFRLEEIGDLVWTLMDTRASRRTAALGSGLVDPRSFAENACDLIAEISSDGRLLYVNPSVEAKLGYTAEQLTGRRVFEFIHHDDLPEALEFLQKAMETGSASRGAHRVRCCDGRWCWFESSGNPYRTADGERRVIAISRDVTERLRNVSPEARLETIVPPPIRSAGRAEASSSKHAPKQAGPETILLIEDEDSLRSVILETLEEEGYAVVPAASGEEALEKAAHHSGPIHLILSDVVMPGIDGRELVKRVGALRPQTRVILMSESPADAIDPLPRVARPPGFLRKPFTLAALRAKLHEVLDEEPDPHESS